MKLIWTKSRNGASDVHRCGPWTIIEFDDDATGYVDLGRKRIQECANVKAAKAYVKRITARIVKAALLQHGEHGALERLRLKRLGSAK